MNRIGRLMAIGLLAAGLIGGAAFGWPNTQPGQAAGAAGPAPEPPVEPALPRTDPRATEAAVRLTWAAPQELRVNRAAPYTLRVENTAGQPVQKVTVQVRVPAGVTAADTDPPARVVGGVLLWELGTLQPHEAKQLKLNVSSPTRGELTARAWVTFTGTAATTVTVKEPKLEAFIEVPETVELGGSVKAKYRVRNTGDTPASNVIVNLHQGSSWSLYENVNTNALSPRGGVYLEPGKEYASEVGAEPDGHGTMTFRLSVTGDDGLTATATAKVKVLAPKLEVSIAGPAEVGIGKTAAYRVIVKNTGDLTAENVEVTADLPEGVRHTATYVGTHAADLDIPVRAAGALLAPGASLKPGESATLTVEGTAIQPGEYTARVNASEKRGAKGSAACRTHVRGVPGIRMEVIDSIDPLEKGKEAMYEVRVSNTGTEADRNLKLVCNVPVGMSVVSVAGPVGFKETSRMMFGSTQAADVVFEPVRELGPKTEVVFKVVVKASTAGTGRFTASITSDHLTAPVTKEESTTVYGE